MDNFKETTLKGHIHLCELRYKSLERRLDNVEARLTKIENQVADLKTQSESGFAEIKLMLERQNTSKQTQLIATIGTIIVAAVGAMVMFIK
jgi:uncharacterized protein involved in exopolysaccharide biosynthesis